MATQTKAFGLTGEVSQYISIKRDNLNQKLPVILRGKGSELSNKQTVDRKHKKKLVTSKLVLNLIDVAAKKGDEEIIQAYWNTYHCQNQMISSGGRTYGKYCKNRFCTVCCGIRKADIINRYYDFIKTWEEPHLVTVTAKAVPARSLKKRVSQMLQGFDIIFQLNKKRHQRGKAIKIIGIKSLECNFNPVKKTYNPHFHFIVQNSEAAELLVSEWLRICTPKFAIRIAQNIKKIDNLERALIEVIKYSSKIFTEPDGKEDGTKKVNPLIYVKALHNILNAMKGHRIFDRFGFNLPQTERSKEKSFLQVHDYKVWNYDPDQFNWIDKDSDELLTDYKPPPMLMTLMENNFDLVSE